MQEGFVRVAPRYIVDENDKPLMSLRGPRPFGAREREELDLRKSIRDITVGIKKYADVDRINSSMLDDKFRDEFFEYFRVRSGMNINVPEGKIKELRFYLAIYADGEQSRDAIVIDGFPNDKIKHVKIVRAKVGVRIDRLLRFIPHPVAQIASELVEINIEPWEIDWGYDRLQVGFSEGGTDTVDWYLSGDDLIQSFECYVTLKKKATVRKVTGKAWVLYRYEHPSRRVRKWFKRIFGVDAPSPKSEKHEFDILP